MYILKSSVTFTYNQTLWLIVAVYLFNLGCHSCNTWGIKIPILCISWYVCSLYFDSPSNASNAFIKWFQTNLYVDCFMRESSISIVLPKVYGDTSLAIHNRNDVNCLYLIMYKDFSCLCRLIIFFCILSPLILFISDWCVFWHLLSMLQTGSIHPCPYLNAI